jgi:hypothetical protein
MKKMATDEGKEPRAERRFACPAMVAKLRGDEAVSGLEI